MTTNTVPLPYSVQQLLEEICVQKLLPMPDAPALKLLAKITEESAIDVLNRIKMTSKNIYNLSGYISYLVKMYGRSISDGQEVESLRFSDCGSPSSSSVSSSSTKQSAVYDSATSKQFFESPCRCKSASPAVNQYCTPISSNHGTRAQQQSSSLSCSSLKDAIPNYGPSVNHNVSPGVRQFINSPSSISKGANSNYVDQHFSTPSIQKKLFASSDPPTPNQINSASSYVISQQSLVLSDLEFRKLFMVYSYVGSNKVEDVVSIEDAIKIKSLKTTPMLDFEEYMWNEFGCRYCQRNDRAMYLDWDSGKTHLYTCYVCSDGSYKFKGPHLDTKKTHLQRVVGDENVLIVKFAEFDDNYDKMTRINYVKIAEAGILVGLSRYRLFGAIKSYFIKRESIAPWDEKDTWLTNFKTTHDLRCCFMHVHMVSSMAKYIARFSLILSTTIKLPVDLATVSDENGCILYDEDGERMIQTDGTGFISEDLAVLVPNDFYNAKYMKDKHFELFDLVQPEFGSTGHRGSEMPIREPPLLIQCRLYKEGLAVKGTLLVNKKLKPRTIQVRPSMIKVKKDPRLSDTESFDSLEVVAVSHKLKAAKLSKTLIALLSIGGVPKEFFLKLLKEALEDAKRVCLDPRAAFRVANIYQHIDDSGICLEMLGACIPLSEPFLQHRLSQLAKEKRKGLGEGKIPISDSFYLMGTTDPTGILDSDEVCVLLENGQISGKVLVYRNPGLHFGDVHVLKARYVKELEDYTPPSSKFAIFFSTKGRRSVANEIATGDFDGDMYWVSNNHDLLRHFKPCEPWTPSCSTPNAISKTPSDLSHEEIEHELRKQLFSSEMNSISAGIAADSCMAFTDQHLMLQDDDTTDKKDVFVKKILKLIDLYYDALDASKSGKKVVIPNDLKATKYPHYMDRKPVYRSTSILGQIYDAFQSCKNEKLPVQEIWKLHYFNISNVPDSCLSLWKERYEAYRQDMSNACKNDISKNDAASSVIEKYKQLMQHCPTL
ncbi:RNA-dependent RNA polymerase family protein [Artemisia annua]|uniref:RNA-dependent RNA polymerase n=1 Tax=Artemisia annua TaxID=35608 RepID=A0A2U1Q9D2_ARTAN|nr:RNA-dependent RNA polymerase family protein [Artemisia annua]